MGLRLLFLPNFPRAMFIQGGTFIPDSRVSMIVILPLSIRSRVILVVLDLHWLQSLPSQAR